MKVIKEKFAQWTLVLLCSLFCPQCTKEDKGNNEDNNQIIEEKLTIAPSGDNAFFTISRYLLDTTNAVSLSVNCASGDGDRWTLDYDRAGDTLSITAHPSEGCDLYEKAEISVLIKNTKGASLASGRAEFINSLVNSWQAIVESAEGIKEALGDDDITFISMERDISLSKAPVVTSDKCLQLGGHTLTTPNGLDVKGTQENPVKVTLENGTIVNETSDSGSMLSVDSYGTLELDNITFTGKDWGCIVLDPHASNAHIIVKNSTINGGYYAVSTNASNPVGSGNTIELYNSTFTAWETAVLQNVTATLTAEDCSFTGGFQVLYLRGGENTFKSCSINLKIDPDYGDYPEGNQKDDGCWGDGNNSVTAPMVLGTHGCDSHNKSSYAYSTSVTLEGCTFSAEGDAVDGMTQGTNGVYSVYAYSHCAITTAGDCPVSLYYDISTAKAIGACGSGLYANDGGGGLIVNGEKRQNVK